MSDLSATIIMKALDCLAVRQQFNAQNIANASSSAYTPVRVSFEENLRSAAAQGPEAVRTLTPSLELDQSFAGRSELRLDLELASASQTSKRYGALIDLLNRQMSLRRAVISEGGR